MLSLSWVTSMGVKDVVGPKAERSHGVQMKVKLSVITSVEHGAVF